MTATFNPETASIDEWKAEIARRDRNRKAGRRVTDDGVGAGFTEGVTGRPTIDLAPVLLEPVTLTLPWSCLVPDNAKYVPGLKKSRVDPRGRGVMLLSAQYRVGKKAATEAIQQQLFPTVRDVATATVRFPHPLRLQLLAQMVEPDRKRTRDLSNYAKLVHDALTGLMYDDDSQLDAVTWLRLPPNIDHPRLELTVAPLPSLPNA